MLVVMVRVRVRGWAIHYVSESPHKDRSVCVCLIFFQCFLFKNETATSEL